VVGSRGGGGEVNGAPLDVEDTIRRSAGHRGEDTAGAARVSRAACVCVGAQIIPIREDGVVVRAPRQTHVGKGRVRGRELRITVRR
jgi:hypothetical protein